MIFLDSDDYLLPFCLEQRVKIFNEHQDCDFIVFPIGINENNEIAKQIIPQKSSYLIEFLSSNILWQTMCPLWKKTFVDALGGFTEGYPRLNDPELMIRAFLQSGKNYMVFNELNYDAVFVKNVDVDINFKNRVYESLKLFVHDISFKLEAHNKPHYKPYLALYLHLWFKYFYVPMRDYKMKQSLQLIFAFRKEKIITNSKALSLILRLVIYAVSRLLSGKPINKLTDKALYIPEEK